VNTGSLVRTFTGHTSSVRSVAFSPDGQWALSGSWDNTLKLWDVNNGSLVRSFEGHTSYVLSVAFSPDGQTAFSGSGDGTLKLWDVNTGSLVRSFEGHTDWVNSVAFSPDGQWALSGSGDETLKLWDLGIDKTPPRIVLKQRGLEEELVSDTIDYTVEGQAIDKSGISSIKVNGKSILFDNAGNFRFNAKLVVGENSFSLSATDKYDNTAHKTFNIFRRGDSIQIAGQYYALVIGINNYLDFSDLETAVNDAKAVAEVLDTRKGILRALNKFNRKISKNDSFLIYYAGHGYYDKNVQKAYWWPTDAENDDTTFWLIADDITSNIRRNAARNILVVSDSCYSGTFREDKVNLNIASEDRWV